MSKLVGGEASKLLVALLGVAATVLGHYAAQWWEPAAVAALTAVAVYLVPNAPAAPVLPPLVP